MTKEFAAVPGKIFGTYNHAQVQKQLLLANSIQGAEDHLKSLNQFYDNQKNKGSLNKQADASMQVLYDYGQKMAYISSDMRSNQLDTAALATGADLDKLISNYNTLVPSHQIPTGIGSLFGQAVSAAGDIYIRHKQAKAVKSFITKGDTLIVAIAGAIKESLGPTGNNSLKALIEQEKVRLASNYLVFRKTGQEEIKLFALDKKTGNAETAGSHSGQLNAWRSGSFDADRLYLQSLTDLDAAEQLRQQFVAAADQLRAAHHQILVDLQQRRNIKYIHGALKDYAGSVKELYSTYKKIK